VSSIGSFFSYVNDARSHEPEVYISILFHVYLSLTSPFVFSIDFVKIVRFLSSVRWYYAQFLLVLIIVILFYSLTVMQSGQG